MKNTVKTDDIIFNFFKQICDEKDDKKCIELGNNWINAMETNLTKMEQNLNNQDYHHAFLYFEKLFILNPSIYKLYETLIYIIAKTKNWHQLLTISDKAYSKKIINKDTLNENKSIGYYEIANVKYSVNINDALKIKALPLAIAMPISGFIKSTLFLNL